MAKKVTIKTKHVPIRTCIATGNKMPKKELLRIVYTNDGQIIVDLKGKLKGRGANLTPSLEAFDLAVKKQAIKRALKLEKALTPEQLIELRNDFAEAIEQKFFRPNNKPVTIKVSKKELDQLKV